MEVNYAQNTNHKPITNGKACSFFEQAERKRNHSSPCNACFSPVHCWALWHDGRFFFSPAAAFAAAASIGRARPLGYLGRASKGER